MKFFETFTMAVAATTIGLTGFIVMNNIGTQAQEGIAYQRGGGKVTYVAPQQQVKTPTFDDVQRAWNWCSAVNPDHVVECTEFRLREEDFRF